MRGLIVCLMVLAVALLALPKADAGGYNVGFAQAGCAQQVQHVQQYAVAPVYVPQQAVAVRSVHSLPPNLQKSLRASQQASQYGSQQQVIVKQRVVQPVIKQQVIRQQAVRQRAPLFQRLRPQRQVIRQRSVIHGGGANVLGIGGY